MSVLFLRHPISTATAVSSDHTLANVDLHSFQSNRPGKRPTATPFHQPDHSAPGAFFENALWLYIAVGPRRRRIGVFNVPENGNRRSRLQRHSRFIRNSDWTLRRGPRKLWRSITGYIFIPTYPPARTASRTDGASSILRKKNNEPFTSQPAHAFSFPDPAATTTASPPSNQWQEFQSPWEREIKTIKWPAAMPDLTSKVAELFQC